ncbi:unnamed protein product [Onchocerca ochengi]|uniref:Ketoacyl_synth_N domain-containing protein n=1 Tax=Onchocerca ochengi TaxID=42157 RepID=A0A182EZJ1_ONCOC|nr:unnamed protein product [Onchocerca ochengi]
MEKLLQMHASISGVICGGNDFDLRHPAKNCIEDSFRNVRIPLYSSPGYSKKSDRINSTSGRLPIQIAVISASLVGSADDRSMSNASNRSI